MHNILILGSGRSGTSMVAALFRNSGIYQGEALLPATDSNKYGYFECKYINRINDRLIERMLQWWKGNRRLRPYLSPVAHRDPRCYWTAAPRRLRFIEPLGWEWKQMRPFTERQPFCYKDPRFNLTLPIWHHYVPGAVRQIVVFREPHKTVDSMLRDRQMYDPPLAFDARWGYLSWYRNYRRLLRELSRDGQWLFVHYRQVLSGEAMPAIEAFAGTRVDASLIDPGISKTQTVEPDRSTRGARRCGRLYQELVERAEQDVGRWSQLDGTVEADGSAEGAVVSPTSAERGNLAS